MAATAAWYAAGVLKSTKAQFYTKVSMNQEDWTSPSYLASVDVDVFNLSKLGKSGPQSTFLDLTEDALDVGAPLVSIDSWSLVLCTRLLFLVSSHTLPACSLALAG